MKDPKKRPSSEKLLKHHFFKRARAPNYLSKTILDGLAPLGDRFRTLKVFFISQAKSLAFIIIIINYVTVNGCYTTYYIQAKEAALLGQNKALYEDKEQLSQVREILFSCGE